MITFENTSISGLKLGKPVIFRDLRGYFVKTFHKPTFEQCGIDLEICEEFFTLSHRNVIRGMHFQTPPFAANKFVYCTHGRVTDVILDLRKGSPTYGKFEQFELSSENRLMLYIPVGLAHGYIAREEENCVVYITDAPFDAEHDKGLLWNSFGFEWGADKPVLSPRDEAFPPLENYDSPFHI